MAADAETRRRGDAETRRREVWSPCRRVAVSPCLLLVPCLFASCRSCELVEAELRTRERQLRVTQEALQQSQCLNQALVNELQALKHNVSSKLPPDKAPGFT